MKKSSFLIPMAGFFCLAFSGLALSKTFNVSSAQELQEALEEAQNNGESDVVQLMNGQYEILNGTPFTFASAEGFDLTLIGNEADPTQVVLKAGGATEALTLSNGKSGGTFTLKGLTIVGGGQGLKTENANTRIEFCAFTQHKPYATPKDSASAPASAEQLTILSSVFTGQTPPMPGSATGSGRIHPAALEQSGNWVLLGTSEPITDMSQFDQFNAVWSYQNDEWKLYSVNQDIKIRAQSKGVKELTKIPAHSGFWVWRD